ncbi:MAG: glycosyltransferase family 9 protein [Bacteroidetes bacterium]|nr:glycosyltransferase family 9 protein [Bacteroidota bacterium]
MITPNNILIIRTDRIGDVILSLPLAALIKKHFPECKVSFLLKEYAKDLVGDHPYIDDVLILQESNGRIPIFKNVNRLKSNFFDASIIVYPTFITALIVFLSRIMFRIGSGYRWYSFLFNKRIYEHRKYAEKHELEFNVNLLQTFGIIESITTMNVDRILQSEAFGLVSPYTPKTQDKIDRYDQLAALYLGRDGERDFVVVLRI